MNSISELSDYSRVSEADLAAAHPRAGLPTIAELTVERDIVFALLVEEVEIMKG